MNKNKPCLFQIAPATGLHNGYSSCRHSVSGIFKYIKINNVLVYAVLSIKGSKWHQLKLTCLIFLVDTGHKTYQHATSSAPQGQLQRQTLLVIGGQKRCPSVPASKERSLAIPVQPYTMAFYPEYRPQPEIKGMSFDFLCADFSQILSTWMTYLSFCYVSQKDTVFQTLYRGGKLATSHDSKIHFTVEVA